MTIRSTQLTCVAIPWSGLNNFASDVTEARVTKARVTEAGVTEAGGKQPAKRWASFFFLSIVLIFLSSGMPAKGVEPEDSDRNQWASGQDRNSALLDTKKSLGQNESDSVDRYQWSFSRKDDPGYTGWPLNWQRKTGGRYPKYIQAGIVAIDPDYETNLKALDANVLQAWQQTKAWIRKTKSLRSIKLPVPPSIAAALVDRYFRADLNGGEFEARSPILPADRTYQYRFTCRMITDKLYHDSAKAELVFVDADEVELASFSTPDVSGTTSWNRFEQNQIIAPRHTSGMFVRVAIAAGKDGAKDIFGSAGWDDILIERYPQLQLATDRPMGVYRPNDKIEVIARAMGIESQDDWIEFQVSDQFGNEVSKTSRKVPDKIDEKVDLAIGSSVRTVRWQLGKLPSGFYRVHARLTSQPNVEGKSSENSLASSRKQRSGLVLSMQTNVAVINPELDGTARGPFGFSFQERIDDAISPNDWTRWLLDSGVSWVKYPCWIEPDDAKGSERILNLMAKLQESGIVTIGRLDHPPSVSSTLNGSSIEHSAASYFQNRETWISQLDQLMARLTLKLRTWQLGSDSDFSFLEHSQLKRHIEQIAMGLQGFGQPLEIALPWPWLETTPAPEETSWQAVVQSSNPALTADELDAFLSLRPRSGTNMETWLSLQPLPKSQYSQADRVTDLVRRMAVVRSHRVAAATIDDPSDPEHGILSIDSRPSELYLPWRTTSRLLGDVRRIGSLQRPSKIHNHVFTGSQKTVWMVWADEPVTEELLLGDDVYQWDVWGNKTKVETVNVDGVKRHRVSIGTTPTFITGVDREIMMFRLSVQLPRTNLDSVLGRALPFGVEFKNPFLSPITGKFAIETPDGWNLEQRQIPWELSASEKKHEKMRVILGNSAKIGDYWLPIHFKWATQPPRNLTVYRKASVGPVGLIVTNSTRLGKNGNLRVTIEMTNRSASRMAFDCLLSPPGRRYDIRFKTIEPGKTERIDFVFPNAADLVGKSVLLHANEQDGPRVLNYEIAIEP